MAPPERILVIGAIIILKKLVSVVTSEISLAWGVDKELQNLKETLELISAKTSDAEMKQVNDAQALLWLKRLKGASYDADDILDEVSYKAMRQSEKKNGQQSGKTSTKVKDFFSSSKQVASRFKMAHKIKAINKQLSQIATDMQKFHFESTSETSRYDDLIADRRWRETISFFGDELNIVGREHDKSEIVKLLISSSSVNSNPQEKVSVISIVGMGGLGKTTLAQSIYKSVEKYFTKRIWVCVSDEFDLYKILVNIVESSTMSKCPEFSNINVLVDKVKKELENKLYFLVLDDLWTEDFMEWNNLKSILDVGLVGSKIIITTRKQEVASMVRGLIPPYNLEVLSDAECWSIIKEKAFSPGGAFETENMINIGKQIAKRCRGLPLAATFLGGLMRMQNDERQWLSIRDDKNLETPENQSGGIMPILKLSYDNLPSHLKQCFAYCCLFPKDWVYSKQTLIQLWSAEGFLHPRNGGNQNSLEDIGNDYFLGLLCNSFFQGVKRDNVGDVEEFKMHDLVHDLALSIVGSHEVTILNASEIPNDDVFQIRRLQLIMQGEVSEPVSNVLLHAKKLRTVFFTNVSFSSWSLLSNKQLRVLYQLRYGRRTMFDQYYHRDLEILSFPFTHLRYLDLSSSAFEDVHAVSISQLYNLETLNLYNSKNVQMVVNKIGTLQKLRHLDLSGSDIQVLPTSIVTLTNLQNLNLSFTSKMRSNLHKNIGSLQNLLYLNISCTKISELPDSITRIHKLKRLEFEECRHLRELPSNFGALTQLRSLVLSYSRIPELPESLYTNHCKLEMVNIEYCYVVLKDIKNWVELRFLNYEGAAPRGIEMLTRLEVLTSYLVRDYIGYNVCESSGIEELANLNSLRILNIKHLGNVRSKLDAERAKLKDKQNIRELGLYWEGEEELVANNYVLVLDGLQPNPNLRKLEVVGFSGLKFPNWMGSRSCLSNLVELYISSCYRCEKLPTLGILPCLQVLLVSGMYPVKCLGEEFYYQEEEERQGSAKATAAVTSSFPSLIKLSIGYMRNLERWITPPPPHNSFPVLENLSINMCDVLISIPDLRSWSSLRRFSISGCDKWKKSVPYDLKNSLNFIKDLSIS